VKQNKKLSEFLSKVSTELQDIGCEFLFTTSIFKRETLVVVLPSLLTSLTLRQKNLKEDSVATKFQETTSHWVSMDKNISSCDFWWLSLLCWRYV